MKLSSSIKGCLNTRQSGIALITVMLIVALCSIIAAQMTLRLQTQMQRSTNISFNQQAYWYAMGAEAFAKRVLMESFKGETAVTHLEQEWAAEESTYPVDFGEIGGEITDLQSCLNLNAFHPSAQAKDSTSSSDTDSDTDTDDAGQLPAATVLQELIILLDIEGVSTFEAEAMVNALTDWFDSDTSITGTSGAEDNDYSAKEFPYLAANSYLGSVNELRLIEHFTPEIILELTPYVCVLPQNPQNLININTLSAEQPKLLQALLGSSAEEAESLLSARDVEGYTDISDFFALSEFSELGVNQWQKDQFVVDSDYFKLKASARFNNSYFNMNSILKVDDKQQIQVISRTIGRN